MRRIRGTAAREDVDDLKVSQCQNDGEQQYDSDNVSQQRERDAPKALPCACAIYNCGFVQFLRNRLHTRQETDRVKWNAAPDIDNADRNHGPGQTKNGRVRRAKCVKAITQPDGTLDVENIF